MYGVPGESHPPVSEAKGTQLTQAPGCSSASMTARSRSHSPRIVPLWHPKISKASTSWKSTTEYYRHVYGMIGMYLNVLYLLSTSSLSYSTGSDAWRGSVSDLATMRTWYERRFLSGHRLVAPWSFLICYAVLCRWRMDVDECGLRSWGKYR